MQKPQFPFHCPYIVTQTYSQNANNYPEGHHGALDIVPLKNGGVWPAPIYPMFNGSAISIKDTNNILGRGVLERVQLDSHFVNYLKDNDCLNGSDWPITDGKFYLDILYWHMLDVTDTDGILETMGAIGLCGNTGDVYSNGQKVPDSQKGVPPYPGLHLHLETSIFVDSSVCYGYLNRDKDPRGRIDPYIIINYPGNMTIAFKKVNDPTYYVQVGTVLVPLADPQALTNIGGSLTDVVELSDSEFAKFTLGEHTLFKSN